MGCCLQGWRFDSSKHWNLRVLVLNRVYSTICFANITQHIPDKSLQLVRYYGWYSNKMRGQRNKQAESREGAGETPGSEVEIIDVSEHRSRRPPSASRPRPRRAAGTLHSHDRPRLLPQTGVLTRDRSKSNQSFYSAGGFGYVVFI